MNKYSQPDELGLPYPPSSMEHTEHASEPPLDDERREELRQRIAGRYYCNSEVRKMVARRLLDDWRTSS